MKNIILLLVLASLMIYSCDQRNSVEKVNDLENDLVKEEEKLSDNIEDVATEVTDLSDLLPCYIINISASKDVSEASEKAKELEKEFDASGFIWIPDYKSLSGKEMYVSFVGPYVYDGECIRALRKVRAYYPDAYAVLVSNDDVRKEIYGQFDIRHNGKKQDLIFYYADPVQEEAYYEEGGEDWGWFINDISVYFSEKYDNVFMSSAVDFFDQQTLNEIIEEFEIEGFGYILIKGNEKFFIPHDMPEVVVSQTCDFFGYEYLGFDYGDMN